MFLRMGMPILKWALRCILLISSFISLLFGPKEGA